MRDTSKSDPNTLDIAHVLDLIAGNASDPPVRDVLYHAANEIRRLRKELEDRDAADEPERVHA